MGSGLHGLLLIPIVDVLLYCIMVYMYCLYSIYINGKLTPTSFVEISLEFIRPSWETYSLGEAI